MTGTVTLQRCPWHPWHPWHPWRLARLALAALALTGACGPFHRGADEQSAIILFTNEALDQADVYGVVSGAQALRIGTVMPGRTDTLRVPPELTAARGTVNIVARILAHSAPAETGPVSIQPGERYLVRLPPDAKMLSFLPAP